MTETDLGPKLIGGSLGSAAAATVFGLARVYCSKNFHGRVYFEDWVVAVTVILLWTGAALLTTAAHHGLGRHWDTLDADERFYSRFYYILGIWPAIMAIAVPKLAIVGLINRIFCPSPLSRALLWSSVVIGLLNYLTVCLYSTFLCLPVQAFWDDSIKNAKCISHGPYSSFAYYSSTFSALVDLYLAIYPAAIFRGLNFSRRKKMALSCALGLGVFATVIAAVKISYTWVLKGTNDFSWDIIEICLWTFVESAVITVAACVPVLHPLYGMAREGVHRIRGSLGGGTHQPLSEEDGAELPPTESMVPKTPIKGGHWTRMLNQAVSFASTSQTVDGKESRAESRAAGKRTSRGGGKKEEEEDETAIVTNIEMMTGVHVAEPESVRTSTRFSKMPV